MKRSRDLVWHWSAGLDPVVAGVTAFETRVFFNIKFLLDFG